MIKISERHFYLLDGIVPLDGSRFHMETAGHDIIPIQTGKTNPKANFSGFCKCRHREKTHIKKCRSK